MKWPFWIMFVVLLLSTVTFYIYYPDPVTREQLLEEALALPHPDRPVSLLLFDLDDAFGDCDRQDYDFVIRIDPDLSAELASLILIHEWAHTLSWDAEVENGDHCDEWGAAYARCYRALYPEVE